MKLLAVWDTVRNPMKHLVVAIDTVHNTVKLQTQTNMFFRVVATT